MSSEFLYPNQDLVELPGEKEEEMVMKLTDLERQAEALEASEASEKQVPGEVAAATVLQVFEEALPFFTDEELEKFQRLITAQQLWKEKLPF
jgi:hypothetical protein